MRTYEIRHVVSFEETNFVGNVYFVSHLRWQGRCREMFLKEHAPEVLRQFTEGFRLVTTRCTCEYYADLLPFDEIVIRMRLKSLGASQLELGFEYLRLSGGETELVARGGQDIACLRQEDGNLVTVPVPAILREALQPYMSG